MRQSIQKLMLLLALLALMTMVLPSLAIAAQATIAWDQAQTGRTPTDFFVYRQDNCTGVENKVGSVAWPVKQFTDATLSPNGLYCWTVTAYDKVELEESGHSNSVRFQVPKEALAVPLRARIVPPVAKQAE